MNTLVPPLRNDAFGVVDAALVDGLAVEQHRENDLAADVVAVVHPDEGLLLDVPQRSAQLLLRHAEQVFQVLRGFQCGGNF